MATKNTPDGRAPYALGFATLDREVDRIPLTVQGQLPAWLKGSLIRTAPAKFEVGQQSYQHWFDGLAMLHLFTFSDGGVTYSNRFLRSKSFCDAAEKNRIARGEFMTDPCRTLFGRVMAVFNPKPTDNANVNVSVLAGRIVALTETPLPIRFDPETLQTMGGFDYPPASWGQVSTAHPQHDGVRGYSYVISMGRKSKYRLFVDENGTQRVLAELPVDRPCYMHSFGMSERHLIVTEFPFCVNPLRLMLSGQPFIRNYQWRPEDGTRITVVDKASGAVVARAMAPPCFAFHHVNAYETNGSLLVDVLTHPDAGIVERLRLSRLRAGPPVEATAVLTRYTIPLASPDQSTPLHVHPETLCSTQIELPRIDYLRRAGRNYRYIWGTGLSRTGDFLDNITKIELANATAAPTQTWYVPGCYPGEPVFVSRPDGTAEDDGVLLSVVLDTASERSFLLILNAADLTELGRASVPHHIPFGFHGNHFPDPHHPDAVAGSAAS